MFKIANINLDNNIFLAPMAGVSDLSFRLLCKRFGAGLVYSEMVSAKALYYNDKKTMSLLETSPQESPLAVQIFGNEPDIMAYSAAKLQDMGVELLDINFGCPAPKITSNGEGSALLKTPSAIGEIVSKVTGAVKIPVMCKIRAGYDEYTDLAVLGHILEDSGAAAICLHARTRAMFYSGCADWSKIATLKSAVKIPVIGNGDVTDGKSSKNMLDSTGCDAVMIGRAAQGNPFIFEEINCFIRGVPYSAPLDSEKLQCMKKHIELMVNLKGEYVAIREARKHIAWYTKGMHGGAQLRQEIFKTQSLDSLNTIIDEYIYYIKSREEL